MKTLKHLMLASSVILLSTTLFSGASAADLMNKSKVIKAPQTNGGICQKSSVAPAESTIAQVAGGDIFGFTSGTDTGVVGDCGVALETTTRFGKDSGKYESLLR